jgi:hypothetical protein
MHVPRRTFLGLAAAGFADLAGPHARLLAGAPLAPTRLAWPIEGAPGPAHPVCDAFGPRIHGEYDWHTGIDLLGVPGVTLVRAAAKGRVARSAGARVELRHGFAGELSTLYDHLSARFVRAGESVQVGQPLGCLGPPHLHFEVRAGGQPRNPYGYLRHVERGGHRVQVLWVDSLFMPHTVDVHLSVKTPRQELDVDRILVRVREFASGELLDRKWVGFDAGYNCGGPSACVDAGNFSVCLTPREFTHTAPEWSTLVSFKRMLAADTVHVEADVFDVRGNVHSDAVVAP